MYIRCTFIIGETVDRLTAWWCGYDKVADWGAEMVCGFGSTRRWFKLQVQNQKIDTVWETDDISFRGVAIEGKRREMKWKVLYVMFKKKYIFIFIFSTFSLFTFSYLKRCNFNFRAFVEHSDFFSPIYIYFNYFHLTFLYSLYFASSFSFISSYLKPYILMHI